MTLRAVTAIPIPDSTRGLGIAPGQPTFGAPPPAPGPAAALDVPWFGQDCANWCWAASAMMGAHFYGKNGRVQCEIASVNFGTADCCPAQRDGPCDRWNDAAGISRCWTEQNMASTMVPNAVPWSTVQGEIDAGRPLEVGWKYAGGTQGHVLLVVGYFVEQEQWVVLNDPQGTGGGMRMQYSDLLTAGNTGTWTCSWIDLS